VRAVRVLPFLLLACRSDPAVDTGASIGTPREAKDQPRVPPEPLDPPGVPSLAPPLDPILPAPGGSLPGKDVEAVVSSHRTSIAKACRPHGCDGTKQATVTIDIDPAGNVKSATPSGDPVVAACILRFAKKWKFPASTVGGNFAIPFVYKCDE
jgi:hypothetical protein